MKLAALIFLLSTPAFACLNEMHRSTELSRSPVNALLALQPTKSKKPLNVLRAELEAKLAKSRSIDTLNDLAVVNVRLGGIPRAIALLEELERRYPGMYQTATNLGTAYELAGRNDEALKWIREGLRRNRKSHDGTEWLHVRILEAKIALARNPRWLDTHRVSGLKFDPQSAQATLPEGLSAAEVHRGLQVQLRERLPFTPRKDEIVSQLLEDYAYLTDAVYKVKVDAGGIYRLAAAYTAVHADELQRKAQEFAREKKR